MPNQRAAGQKCIALAIDHQLLAAIDAARRSKGHNRSQFIRAAIVDYVGFSPDAIAPDRTRLIKQVKKLGYPIPPEMLNESASGVPNESKPGTVKYKRKKT